MQLSLAVSTRLHRRVIFR